MAVTTRFHLCECRGSDSGSAASSVSVSARQGQASSGVFLKQAHWSAAIQFVFTERRGVRGQDETT